MTSVMIALILQSAIPPISSSAFASGPRFVFASESMTELRSREIRGCSGGKVLFWMIERFLPNVSRGGFTRTF